MGSLLSALSFLFVETHVQQIKCCSNNNFESTCKFYSDKYNDIQELNEKCKSAETAEDILDVADYYYELHSQDAFIFIKEIYNQYIGWALPTRHNCKIILDAWKNHVIKYPNSNFVDLGAGTGVFCKALSGMGISQDRLIAIDLPNRTHSSKRNKSFWPITYPENYKVKPDDILFVAWGVSRTQPVIDEYINIGGTCVIILGERDSGCTFPTGYFLGDKPEEITDETIDDIDILTYINKDWRIKLYDAQGPASLYEEQLSVNTKYNITC